MERQISPLFRILSLHFGYNLEVKDPIKFKQSVKESLFSDVKNSMKDYVKGVPFLHFNKNSITDGEIHFSGNLKEFLDSRLILKTQMRELKRSEGLLMPVKRGFIITLNKKSLISKAVTTFAHELGHTFFYEFSNNYPKLIFNKKLLEDTRIYKEFEMLSFEIGRELISPSEYFTKYIIDNNLEVPSLQNFEKMREDFKVISKDVLAKRIFWDLRIWDAYLFWGYLKDRNIIVKNSDKYRIKEGYFKNFTLKEGLKKEGELKVGIKFLKSALIDAIDERKNIDGTEVYCKSERFNKSCKLDMSLRSKTETEKRWFIAMLYRKEA